MPFETVGSDETLLRLILCYQNVDAEGITAPDLWREIATYRRNGGKYNFYQLSQYSLEEPDSQFCEEMVMLRERGFVDAIGEKIVPTHAGCHQAYSLRLSSSLQPLERMVVALAERRVNASQN